MPGEEQLTNATAQLVLTAGVLIAAGITEANHLYKEHKEANLLAQINGVNELHREYLAKIPVAGYSSIEFVSFASIFELTNPNDTKSYRSLTLTNSILDDIDNQVPMYPNPHLAPYSRSLLNSLAYLREFYDDRIHDRTVSKGTEDDVTSSVISYLILMICIHCIKFEGTANGIAYLNGLSKFVKAYASLHNEKSQRFERLTLAHGELVKAKYKLIDHSHSLTHIEQIQEFLPVCTHHIEMMLKNFTKLFVPKEHWKKLDSCTPERLARGIIRPKFKYSHTLLNENAIELPESIFKTWTMRCAKNFILAQCVDRKSDENEMHVGNNDFKNKSFSAKELKSLRSLFKDCPNFLTLQVLPQDVTKTSDRFGPVKDEAKLRERLTIILDYFILMDAIISAQYLCLELWNCINKLTEMYSSDATHECNFIFETFINLCEEIKAQAQKILDAFEVIQKENAQAGAMLSIEQDKLEEKITNSLKSIVGRFHESIIKVSKNHKERQLYPDSVGDIDPTKDNILRVATKISIARNYPTKHTLHPEKIAPSRSSTPLMNNNLNLKKPLSLELTESKLAPRNTSANSPHLGVTNFDLHSEIKMVEPSLSVGNLGLENHSMDIKEDKEDDIDIDVELIALRKKILKQEAANPNIRSYLRLLGSLCEMQAHAKEIQIEQPRKAEAIEAMVHAIYEDALEFLQNKNANTFVAAVTKRLNNNPQSIEVDIHKTKLSKFGRILREAVACMGLIGIYEVYQRGGFFKTTTRAMAKQIESASVHLKNHM